MPVLAVWSTQDHGAQAEPGSGLTISMTDSIDPVSPGEIVTYTITVGNSSITEATDVVVEDTLTGPGIIQSAVPSQGSCDPPAATAVTCTLGTLYPGGTSTITVKKLATVGGGGGIAEPIVLGSDSPASWSTSGSGRDYTAPVAAAAVVAGVLAVAAGGWYVRRRLS